MKPYALFSDGMVLQQGVKCPVFGTADPDEEVSVSIGVGDGIIIAAPPVKADKNGHWAATLGEVKPAAGGPYTLTIKGKNTITIKDVLVGEVWVASGQSNMEMQLCKSAPTARKRSPNRRTRRSTCSPCRTRSPTSRRRNFRASGSKCDPDTVGNFSGVAYYFGRDLQKALNVPVGVIDSSWGGTVAEAWTPKANLEANPDLKSLIHQRAIRGYYKTTEEIQAKPGEVGRGRQEGQGRGQNPAEAEGAEEPAMTRTAGPSSLTA